MPNEQNFKRKLTAILSADVAGYSLKIHIYKLQTKA